MSYENLGPKEFEKALEEKVFDVVRKHHDKMKENNNQVSVQESREFEEKLMFYLVARKEFSEYADENPLIAYKHTYERCLQTLKVSSLPLQNNTDIFDVLQAIGKQLFTELGLDEVDAQTVMEKIAEEINTPTVFVEPPVIEVTNDLAFVEEEPIEVVEDNIEIVEDIVEETSDEKVDESKYVHTDFSESQYADTSTQPLDMTLLESFTDLADAEDTEVVENNESLISNVDEVMTEEEAFYKELAESQKEEILDFQLNELQELKDNNENDSFPDFAQNDLMFETENNSSFDVSDSNFFALEEETHDDSVNTVEETPQLLNAFGEPIDVPQDFEFAQESSTNYNNETDPDYNEGLITNEVIDEVAEIEEVIDDNDNVEVIEEVEVEEEVIEEAPPVRSLSSLLKRASSKKPVSEPVYTEEDIAPEPILEEKVEEIEVVTVEDIEDEGPKYAKPERPDAPEVPVKDTVNAFLGKSNVIPGGLYANDSSLDEVPEFDFDSAFSGVDSNSFEFKTDFNDEENSKD